MSDQRARVSADPAVQFGRPCIDGTRIPAENIAELVAAGETVEGVCEDFNLTRAQVLVACWYYTRHGVGDGFGLRTKLRAAWGPWLADTHRQFAAREHDAIPNPPSGV